MITVGVAMVTVLGAPPPPPPPCPDPRTGTKEVPIRDGRFRHIDDQVRRFQNRGQPGTGKWNTIAHRRFAHIAMHRRGKPLVSLATIVGLLGSTRSVAGLRVHSEIDGRHSPDGADVTTDQMAQPDAQPRRFHGDWTCTLRPRTRK